MNPPIDIQDYRLVEIAIKPNPCFDEASDSEPEFNISTETYQHAEGEPLSRLVMTIKQKKKASSHDAYKISVVIEGLFSYQPDLEKERLNELLELNATSILYGLARGIISQTTATMTNGKLLLPTVNFYKTPPKKIVRKKTK